MRISTLLAAVALLAVASVASADKPWASIDRFQLALGGQYALHDVGGSGPTPQYTNELEIGPQIAYVVIDEPHVALNGNAAYGVSNREIRGSLGAKLTAYDSKLVTAALNVQYTDHDVSSGSSGFKAEREWEVGPRLSHTFTSWLSGAATADYGLDGKQTRVTVGLRLT